MNILKRCVCLAIFVAVAVPGSYAQVSSINSINIKEREFNDVPGAGLTKLYNYPFYVSWSETGVSAPTGFANRDVWRFSNNGGATAYAFNNNEFFSVSMNLRLSGIPIAPRKEAGFLLDTIGGQGQFIVNTDGHEVVAFGGPFPFYAFPATYNSGDSITLGMTYFLDPVTGKRSIIYTANGVNSPVLPFTNLEQGIIDGSTLGGYFQIANDPANPNNQGMAQFGNIVIVPEPSALALLGLGALGFLLRRKA